MSPMRPRFSLQTLLLLMTIVVLALVVGLQWRMVEPLRTENRQMRAELGYLSVEDPNSAYGLALPSSDDRTWKWRIYLPPQVSYELFSYSGKFPDRRATPGKAWFEAVRTNGGGSSGVSTVTSEEFTLEASVFKEEDQWILTTTARKRDTNPAITSSSEQRTSVYQPSGDWLSDKRASIQSSFLQQGEQRAFRRDEPILLFHLQKPTITDLPGGGHTTTFAPATADGVVIWLQPVASTPDPNANRP